MRKDWVFRRAFELALAIVVAFCLAPAIILVAGMVLFSMGRPVLFRQPRAGLRGQPFWICKFRTMNAELDASGRLLPDADRVTCVGRFLRDTSLDELPTLWNVLRGDMSLVGPRPLLLEYVPRYTPEQARRLEVRPGVTGWAQVNGRNLLSWDEKFRLDVWYVEHRTVVLDAIILWRTLGQVVRRRGVRPEGQVTMPVFEGRGGQP